MAEQKVSQDVSGIFKPEEEKLYAEKTADVISDKKKYRKYDFYSPRKFTKDRLKMLDGVFGDYGRIISSRLNGLLHASCDVVNESLKEQRYHEFSSNLTDNDVLFVAKIDQENFRENSPILIYVDTPLALSMVDRLSGGVGDPEDLPTEYKMTELELRMIESILIDLIPALGESWNTYTSVGFSYVRRELNPTLVQPLGYDETVVCVTMTVRFSNISGKLRFCFPGVMLSELFSQINVSAVQFVSGEDQSEEIFNSIRESELEIIAELAKTQLQLSDVYNLNVGDVIDMKRPKDSAVCLNIGGCRWFTGKMGVHNRQIAVRIGEIYNKV